jgi:hypothetical protein
MKPLTVEDLLPSDQYERTRDEYRRRIIGLKENRRIAVGDLITLVFENRDTVLFQVQEMIRAEHIVAPERIREELEMYNEQIPGSEELSATLFIEVTDPKKVKPVLDRFQGIDTGETVGFQSGNQQVYGIFEPGRAKEDKISAVHYLRFPFSDKWKARLAKRAEPIEIFVEHSGYQARVTVSDDMRTSLLRDLD